MTAVRLLVAVWVGLQALFLVLSLLSADWGRALVHAAAVAIIGTWLLVLQRRSTPRSTP